MTKTTFILAFAILFGLIGSAQNKNFRSSSFSDEEVSGVWTVANSPYFVSGEVTVPFGDTLIIEPGVTVKFNTNSVDITQLNPPTPENTDFGYMTVNGALIAQGTETDSIVFTRDGNTGYWGMINFTATANPDNSIEYLRMDFSSYMYLQNATVEELLAGLSFDGIAPTVRNSSLINSFIGIFLKNSPGGTITNNGIHACLNDGIILYQSPANIDNNIISGNSGHGINIYQSPANIENNSISGNGNRGIYIWQSSSTVSGNLISGNVGGGIYSEACDSLNIAENTISGSQYPIKCINNTNGVITGNTIPLGGILNGQAIISTSSTLKISNNTISGAGVGINSGNSNLQIEDNSISGSDYAGIWCNSGDFQINNNIISNGNNVGIICSGTVNAFHNTIVGNWAAMEVWAGPVIFENCIFKYNTRVVAPGALVIPTINWSLVGSAGSQGVGRISGNLDPMFVDYANGDYNLIWSNYPDTSDPTQKSPCIDSGNPDPDGDGNDWMTDPDDRDPDGSRMDMGARLYHQTPQVTAYNNPDPGSPNYQYWNFEDTYIPYTSTAKTFQIRNGANHFYDCPVYFTGNNPEQFKLKYSPDIYLSDTVIHLAPYQVADVTVVFQPISPLTQHADFTAGDAPYTDSVHVQGIGISTGAVIGYVKTPTGEPLQDITITLEALQSPWNTVTTTTNSGGYYQLVNIGLGNFRVTPSKIQDGIIHDFSPESADVLVLLNSTKQQDFTDISYFTVSGNISYLNTSCPAEGIPVLMDGAPAVPPVVTDAEGNYTVEGVLIGSHTFMPDAPASGHIFNPSEIFVGVFSPVAGINFIDEFTYNLSGNVTGSCGISLASSIALVVECQNECGINDTIYTDALGFYSINLAPFQYSITPISFDYFGSWVEFNTAQVDVTEQDATLNFIYHSDPVIEIKGFDTLTNAYGWIVLEQFEIYAAEIDVLEFYGENNEIRCRVTSGAIVITDGLSDFAQDSTMVISDTATLYYFQAGSPNIVPPYQKRIKVEYMSEEGKSASAELWVYVTGILPRGTAFATTTPEIPLLILRDPPGDQSFSEMTETTEVSQAISFSAKYDDAASTFRKVSLGVKYEVDTWLFGVLNIEKTLDFTATVGMAMSQNSLIENQLKFVTSESFKTSTGEFVVGRKSDVYMGGAMNLLYGITDVLTISGDTVNVDQDIIIVPNGFATTYIYTENHIENTVIPSLYLIQDTASAERWESFIALNAFLKNEAIFNENKSFDAGVVNSLSLETTRSSTRTQEFELTINAEIATEAGLKINGIGQTGGVKVSSAITYGSSVTTSTVNSTKIAYTLQDNDESPDGNDNFSVDIKTDPVYGTPVFVTLAGNSMCPWEGPPTNSRKGCAFSQNEYYDDNIPAGSPAVFTLVLNNTSQTEETMFYTLKVLNETNPNSATFTPSNLTSPDGIVYSLEYDSPLQVTIYISRPPGEVYDLSGLTLELSGDCGTGIPNVSDRATFEVHWIHPCSPISIVEPNSNWVINQSGNNALQLTVGDYDLTNPNLLNVSLEYSGDNGNNWIEFYSIPKASILSSTLQVIWNVENLTDGQYQLRATASCAEGLVNYSEKVIGAIDRMSPFVSGNPQPADGVLNIGDEISFTFNESLKPSTVTINTCRLFETETGMQVGASVVYQPATRKVVFTINPGNAYFIENRYLTSQIVGVQDKYGNPLADTASWTFLVDQGPLHWNPDDFMFTITDGESINFSSMLTNVSADEVYYSLTLPEWLTATPFSGYVSGNGASVEVDFMSAPLPGGIYYDTIFATTVGYPAEEIHIMIQTAGGPELLVNPSNQEVLAPAGTTTFDITSNVNWTVSEDVDWLSVDTYGGSENGTLTVNFGGNNSGSFRIGEITVTGGGGLLPVVVTVVQQAWLIHSVNLPAGWSGLSSYVTPFDPDIELIFGSVLDNLIIAMTQQNMYYPANEINTIGNWASQSAYKVKTNAGITLNITGSEMEPDRTLELETGWNLIPVVSECEVDLEALFAPVVADLVIVKEVAGWGLYWPAYAINTLGVLDPGKAYYVLMNASASMAFPDCGSKGAAGFKESKRFSSYFPSLKAFSGIKAPTPTPLTHSIAITGAAQQTLDEGRIIGAYDQAGNCYGLTVTGDESVCLTVFGNDHLSVEKDGFEQGETILFRLIHPANGEEILLTPTFDQNMPANDGTFTGNGLSVITGFEATAGISSATGDGSGSINVFPNPTDGMLNITGLAEDAILTVMNLQGRELWVERQKAEGLLTLKMANHKPGIYFIKIQQNEETIFRKVVLK